MRENREYPMRPIVGVGGVTIRDGSVLLMRRARPPLQGEWSIPGGGLEVGEAIAEGVRREVEEETGIHARVLDHIETFERIVRDDSGRVQYHYVILDYLCEAVGGELRAGGDATDVAWVEENDLPKYSLRDTATRVIVKAFAMARGRSA
ncbi:MAG TPA: NUDIX domain-containing protein [Candidatus Acidoferrales bacterium]|nr:NUDIX domain-containing protein [Candidatus Acidoferrales bacterium]